MRQAIPDYDEVVGLSEVVIAPHITDTILESDRGPEVAYYLAQHPDKAEAINAMSVSYTHLDVYKRQLSMLKIAGLLLMISPF